MTFVYKVTYREYHEDGSSELKSGYVRAKSISKAWEAARKKFGDVRQVR